MAKRVKRSKSATTKVKAKKSTTTIKRGTVVRERAPIVRAPRDENIRAINFKVELESRPDFKEPVAGYLFDSAGNLLEQAVLRSGQLSFKSSPKAIAHNRLLIAPMALPSNDEKETSPPTIQRLERLGAYEPTLNTGIIRIPGTIIDNWIHCLCWVRGKVVKADNGQPVCGARVHICEVDKLIWWIEKLPDLDIFRLRDDILKEIEKPRIPIPRPIPDPPPFDFGKFGFNPQPDPLGPIDLDRVSANPTPHPGPREEFAKAKFSNRLSEVAFNPQPEPLRARMGFEHIQSLNLKTSLNSSSVKTLRQSFITNIQLLIPYLCLWPIWWRFRCDEIAVVTTDQMGRFSILIPCNEDKPDLYFWVEYEINGSWETVYKPPIPCNTYWDYKCGTEVTIRVNDDRVTACDDEPDLPGCVVQVLSIGRSISMSELLNGPGVSVGDEGLNQDTIKRPFGGKLEPRVWFSRSKLRNDKNIHYYQWSYRRLTEGDGTVLLTPGTWTPIKRTVVRHYAKPASGGGISHVPYPLGPVPVGSSADLFEIKPTTLPTGGIEWTVVDEREDLASAHFETHKLGTGTDACQKAFDNAGKYEVKLELFTSTGALVKDWGGKGISLQVTDVPAPFGTGTVTSVNAPNHHRILDGTKTDGFRMILRVDNNCCSAKVEPITGTGLTFTSCGFIEFGPGATVNLNFRAGHPNNFADFDFNLTRAVANHVALASAANQTGTSPVLTDNASHSYTLTSPDDFKENFTVTELLDTCPRAAFAETLHVRSRAVDGYGRMSHLDRHAVDAFSLTQPCPEC